MAATLFAGRFATLCCFYSFVHGVKSAAKEHCSQFPDCVKTPLLPTDPIQYAGRVPVSMPDHSVSGEMAYWLAPSTLTDPIVSPIVVVLEGGPGFPSQIQAVNGCGPYSLSEDGLSVSRGAEPSWNTNVTLLFIDQPLGVGYSQAVTGQTASSADNAVLMMQVMQMLWWGGGQAEPALHPQLAPDATRGRPLFIFGHSYGGRTGPALAAAWLRTAPQRMRGHLSGLILGNALVDMFHQVGSIAPFLWNAGLLTNAARDSVAQTAQWVRGNVTSANASMRAAAADTFYSLSELYYTLKPIQFVDSYDIWCVDTGCKAKRKLGYGRFFNASAVKASLNMPDGLPYAAFGVTALNTNADRASSSLPDLNFVLGRGVRVLVYNGVNDGFLPVQGIRAALYALNYTGVHAFRSAELRTWGRFNDPGDPFNCTFMGNVLVDDPSPGLARLTAVGVFGAGHFANAEVLRHTRQLVLGWIQTNSIPSPTPP